MRFLLDTHVWLWWVSEPERIPAAIRSAIENPANEPLLSVASSWEIAIKCALGKLSLPEPPETYVLACLRRDRIGTLHIEHRHALHVATLPMHHHDPFDRLLVAQSLLEEIPVATVDEKLARYGIALV